MIKKAMEDKKAARANDVILIKLEELGARLDNLNRKLESILSKQETHQRSIDIIDADRQLMEEHTTLMRELKSIVHFIRDKQSLMSKEVKEDINELSDKVIDISHETENIVKEGLDDIVEVAKKRNYPLASKNNFLLRWKRRLKK